MPLADAALADAPCHTAPNHEVSGACRARWGAGGAVEQQAACRAAASTHCPPPAWHQMMLPAAQTHSLMLHHLPDQSPSPPCCCSCWNTKLVLPEPWGPRDIVLVRTVGSDGITYSNHLVCSQVHKLLMGEASPCVQLSDKTFRCALKQSRMVKASDKQTMAKLKGLGASAPQANNVSLAPITIIQKGLLKLDFPPAVVESFRGVLGL